MRFGWPKVLGVTRNWHRTGTAARRRTAPSVWRSACDGVRGGYARALPERRRTPTGHSPTHEKAPGIRKAPAGRFTRRAGALALVQGRSRSARSDRE